MSKETKKTKKDENIDFDLGQGLKYPSDKIEKLNCSDVSCDFVIKPFEQTYGTTVGNSLRRSLLTSLRGLAPVWVKIEGVEHSFATIEGVREDVIKIIANIKKIVFRSPHAKAFILKIEEKGKKDVTAADIKGLSGIEVLNPEQHIASLNEKGSLNIEFAVEPGRGFVTDEENKAQHEDMPINTLFLDSVFSPVTKVSYKVEPLAIDGKFNYEKLTLHVETSGTVTPEEALIYAANILRKNFALIGDLEAYEEEIEEVQEVLDPEIEELKVVLNKKMEELEMSVRSSNCLRRENINLVLDLVQRTETDMLQTKNFGKKSLEEMKVILDHLSKQLKSGIQLSFGMKEFLVAKGIIQKENSKG